MHFAGLANSNLACRIGSRRASYLAMRYLWIFALLTASPFALAAVATRVITTGPHHLGIAGLPEWEEFAPATPSGAQLDLVFTASANPAEATLLIRQRNVKTRWNVTLNGQRLGALETLTQPLLLALAVPAGRLRDGENRLTIARSPSPLLDDIVLGEITLASQPRAALLARAAVTVSVTDADTGAVLPCRLTLADTSGELMPWQRAPAQQLALRTGVIYTGDGQAKFTSAPGTYVLYASRGFEYSVATARLTLVDGGSQTLALQLRREVPTPGLIAADTHIHTLTHSRHGDATIDERMLTIAGEGIELAVATDHNHHADYTEAAQRSGVQSFFRPVVGNEVSTKAGHFNAFPVPAGGPVPDASLTDWAQLLHNIRSVTGARVITLNHPRDVHQNFTPFGPANFDATTGTLRGQSSFDLDAIEVVTSAAMQSDIMLLYRDWFALLNHGIRVAAIGASDTHHVSEFILGQSRTYVAATAPSPADIDMDEVSASYRAGRLLVSFGLLTRMIVNERFSVGDLATGLSDKLQIMVEVLGPSWVTADRVELYANGIKVREQSIVPSQRIQKALVTWSLPVPRHDVHLVAIASGPGITGPFWDIPRPYQPTSKTFTPRVLGSTNPIWIDADNDGRFSSARDYAGRLVAHSATTGTDVAIGLKDYDEAVAIQARALRAAGETPAR